MACPGVIFASFLYQTLEEEKGVTSAFLSLPISHLNDAPNWQARDRPFPAYLALINPPPLQKCIGFFEPF